MAAVIQILAGLASSLPKLLELLERFLAHREEEARREELEAFDDYLAGRDALAIGRALDLLSRGVQDG